MKYWKIRIMEGLFLSVFYLVAVLQYLLGIKTGQYVSLCLCLLVVACFEIAIAMKYPERKNDIHNGKSVSFDILGMIALVSPLAISSVFTSGYCASWYPYYWFALTGSIPTCFRRGMQARNKEKDDIIAM